MCPAPFGSLGIRITVARVLFFDALIRAIVSNRFQNRVDSGRRALRLEPRQVCCNKE